MDNACWALCTAISLLTLAIAGCLGQIQVTNETSVRTFTAAAPPDIPKLPLAIHYEALCPDSMSFIRRRLYNALLDNDWWPRTDLKLYPFGKAAFYNNTKIGEMEVYCQHGNQECELNALHACILEHLELRQAFDMIHCMLRFYSDNIDVCAKRLKLDVTAAKECKRTRKTPEILMPYGKETLALKLSYVPSIVIDNHFASYEQSSIRYNFEAHFCRNYERKFKIKLLTCG